MRAERRCRNEDRSRRGRVTEVTERFGRYWFPAFAGEEMFDIVNREYEENGSFRCDFFATKERDRELVVCGFAGFSPCASRRTVS